MSNGGDAKQRGADNIRLVGPARYPCAGRQIIAAAETQAIAAWPASRAAARARISHIFATVAVT